MVKSWVQKQFDLTAIESKVAEVEKKTSGEIVVFVARASSTYWRIHAFLMVFGWILGSAFFFVAKSQLKETWLPFEPIELFGFQITGALLFALLGQIPALLRIVIPSRLRKEKVTKGAMLRFLTEGLAQTEERTGILIYLSLLEHEARILADKGIHQRVPENYWDQNMADILKGLAQRSSNKNAPTQALCKVIENMGSKLALEFPASTNDRNELSNKVRTD